MSHWANDDRPWLAGRPAPPDGVAAPLPWPLALIVAVALWLLWAALLAGCWWLVARLVEAVAK